MKAGVNFLLVLFFLQLIVLSLMASYRFISFESTITLAIFNFLFASLIFQLNGTTSRKFGLLAAGNFVGLFWNFVFLYFSFAGVTYFGNVFNAFYTIIYPFLNLMWIVPFWALSLSALPRMRMVIEEGKTC